MDGETVARATASSSPVSFVVGIMGEAALVGVMVTSGGGAVEGSGGEYVGNTVR